MSDAKTEIPPCESALELYAFALLGEECSEVAQAAFKGVRFGYDHAARSGNTARHQVSIETGDTLAAIAFGFRAKILDPSIVHFQMAAKLSRLIDPMSTDDEGRRLAPPLPENKKAWTLTTRMISYPGAPPGTDPLTTGYVAEMLADASLVIHRQAAALRAAAGKFRAYEREHHAKAETFRQEDRSLLEPFCNTRMNSAIAKAKTNAEMADLCEEAIDVR